MDCLENDYSGMLKLAALPPCVSTSLHFGHGHSIWDIQESIDRGIKKYQWAVVFILATSRAPAKLYTSLGHKANEIGRASGRERVF